MNPFASYAMQSRSGRRLIREAVRALAWARLRGRASAYPGNMDLFGEPRPAPDGPSPVARPDVVVAREVKHAIRQVADRLPWHSTCLVKALAAKRMLAKRGVPWRVVIGMRFDGEGEDKDVAAHAWLTVGPVVVTGREAMPQHTPVASYQA